MDTINKENYAYWLVLLADGALDAREQAQVEAFLEAHPEIRAEYELFLSAPKVAPRAEVYADKEALKRSAVVPLRRWTRVAAAVACLCVLSGLALQWLTRGTPSAPPVAQRRALPPVAVARPPETIPTPAPSKPAQVQMDAPSTPTEEETVPLPSLPEPMATTTAPAALADDAASYYAMLAEMMLDIMPSDAFDATVEETLLPPDTLYDPRPDRWMAYRSEGSAMEQRGTDFRYHLEHLWWSSARAWLYGNIAMR